MTEFIIAMHLLASYKSGAMTGVPLTLPTGLYDAASRRPPPPARPAARPEAPASAIPRFNATNNPGRTASPLARPPWGTPPVSAQPTGTDWVIAPQEKSSYDSQFSKLDTAGQGFINGDQAVMFFSDSGLPEDVLAQIWDLADINSEGRLNRDEFAVAMYLIRNQRGKTVSNLPSALPPNLVPPSMRTQARTGVPAVSAFDPPTFPPAAPKASDDLFDLAFTPAPAVPQSTGGSAGYGQPQIGTSDPFDSKAASPTSPQAAFSASRTIPGPVFKPYQPISDFGRGLTTQGTGGSAGSGILATRAPAPVAVDEDLLGDADPEVSKKLTPETSELANMSNQIGTMRTQMQEIQQKKAVTQSDLNSTSTQKRDLELRLSQFRTQYENEVKEVRTLEQRLHELKEENKKTGQELAMVEGLYQDLQNRHRQISTDLEGYQRENTSIKERIRQVNVEIGQLRPQLEKMQSDARQQKGMVAINKKQLVTNEGERDKVKSEMSDLSRAAQDASTSAQATPSASAVASPAPSNTSQSTNPFFRKSPSTSTEAPTPSAFARGPPQQDRFDNFFNQSFAPQPSAPPPTSFKSDPAGPPTFSVQSDQSVRSSDRDVPTPSTSPPQSTSYQDSPRTAEPPAPPESRQLTSRELPLRDTLPRNESFSSSVRVQTPASRYGPSGADTPTNFGGAPAPSTQTLERTDTSKTETSIYSQFSPDVAKAASPTASTSSDANRPTSKSEDRRDIFQSLGSTSQPNNQIPGAFPTETPLQPNPTGESTLSDRSKASKLSEGFSSARSDPFSAATSQSRAPGSRVDFDSAFAGFSTIRPQERQNTGSTLNGSVDATASKFNKEFPPIENIGEDDESDSNSDRGFHDNFTTSSPKAKRSSIGQSQPSAQATTSTTTTTGSPGYEGNTSSSFAARTSLSQPPASELPTPNAQKSPPSYDSTLPASRAGGRDANQFPPEFGGLLPSRQDPTAPPPGSQSPEKSFSAPAAGSQGQALFGSGPSITTKPAANIFSTSPQPSETPVSTVPSDAYHTAHSSYPPSGEKVSSPPTTQAVPVTSASQAPFSDEFDSGFDDLTDAKEADDKDNDEFLFGGHQREGLSEFDPTFDSPAASKSNTIHSDATPTTRSGVLESSAFSDFEHSFSVAGKAPQQPTASSSQDWDAIFSTMETSGEKRLADSLKNSPFPEPSPTTGAPDIGSSSSAAAAASQSGLPALSRAISPGTDHDDPILKKLTGMGYPRADALDALEQFDYDISKVRPSR